MSHARMSNQYHDMALVIIGCWAVLSAHATPLPLRPTESVESHWRMCRAQVVKRIKTVLAPLMIEGLYYIVIT